ncbi:Alpha-ketoglutarate-dependent dioxygenase AlkB-like [Dillenia turbinata]|uniref:DNA N(6)-methyladenine demethylase n=1 Tax=Dillenia turbinata TaxID=194707 RepID=A0AAN8UAJ6_9MAGN
MDRGRIRDAGGYFRGRSSIPARSTSRRHHPVGADGSVNGSNSSTRDNVYNNRKQTWRLVSGGSLSNSVHAENTPVSTPSQQALPSSDGKITLYGSKPQDNSEKSVASSSEQCEGFPTSLPAHNEEFPSLSSSVHSTSRNRWDDTRTYDGQTLGGGEEDRSPLNLNQSFMQNIDRNDVSPATSSILSRPSHSKGPESATGTESIEHSEQSSKADSFDICPVKPGIPILKASLFAKNREKRNEAKRSKEGLQGNVLRPGMVLFKKYISVGDQVKIVKICRDLGLGPGGFYQPGYRDGAKLNLRMMCLGKNWDPEKSQYEEIRSVDNAKPPVIPELFFQLVEGAIQDSLVLLAEKFKKKGDSFPSMSPDICIVNFYTTSGRLGLHQDKDESEESLRRGLPVVSFSIGDSAKFLYGDDREIDKAGEVVLESGDVLLFGGKSRNIFHGVTAIIPDTAPKALQSETNLRSGRLNLTFRQF